MCIFLHIVILVTPHSGKVVVMDEFFTEEFDAQRFKIFAVMKRVNLTSLDYDHLKNLWEAARAIWLGRPAEAECFINLLYSNIIPPPPGQVYDWAALAVYLAE